MRQFSSYAAALVTGVAALLAGTAAMTARTAGEARKNPLPGDREQVSFTSRISNGAIRNELRIPPQAIPAGGRIFDDAPFYDFNRTAGDAPAMLPAEAPGATETLRGLVNSDMPWIYNTGFYSMSSTTAPASYPDLLKPLYPTFNLYGIVAGEEIITCEPAVYGTSSFLGAIFKSYDAVTLREKRKFNSVDMMWLYTGAYNPKDGFIYAPLHQFDDKDRYFCALCKINPADLSATIIKTYETGEIIPGTLVFSPEGTLYAIDTTLRKIDLSTGEETSVGATGLNCGSVINAACFGPDGTFYYAFCDNSQSGIYTVDPATGTATKVYSFPRRMEIHTLFPPVPAAADDAPGYPTDVVYDFPANVLDGRVTFTAPEKTFDGTVSLSGTLEYHVLANETELASGTTAPGRTETVSVSVPTYGEYCIQVYVTDANGRGAKAEKEMWIGLEPPTAQIFSEFTVDKENGKFHLTWTQPQSINYTELDGDNLEYRVTRLPDSLTVVTSTRELHQDIPQGAGRKYYSYDITPIYFGLEFEGTYATTSPHSAGDILLPWTEYFNSNASLEDWNRVDANDDGITWRQSGGAMYISTPNDRHDDWLITPPFKLEKGRMYDFTFLGNNSEDMLDIIDLRLGSEGTPEAMTVVVKDGIEISGAVGKRYGTAFRCEKEGTYYLGLHAVSDSRGHYLYVDDIGVSAGYSPEAPAAVTDLVCEADKYGDNKVTISFTAPTLSVTGNPLTAAASVNVYREGTLVTTLHPGIGKKATWVDTDVPAGDVRYMLATSDGDAEGGKAEGECFVGHWYPSDIESVTTTKISENTMTFEWTPVKTDIKGKLYRSNVMQYEVFDLQTEDIIADMPALEYSYTIGNGPQGFYHFRITPHAEGKYGNEARTDMINLGPAYHLPFEESFAQGKINHAWAIRRVEGAGFGRWSMFGPSSDAPSADGDGYCIGFHNDNGFTIEKSRYYSGVIELPAEMKNPVFSFAYLGLRPDDYNTVAGVIREEGGEWQTLFENDCTGDWEWKYAFCDLSDWLGKRVQVGIEIKLTDYVYSFVDDFKIMSQPDYNLTLKDMYAQETVRTGEPAGVLVQVENRGRNTTPEAAVEIYAADRFVGEVPVESLRPGYSTIVEMAYPTDVTTPEKLNFTAKIKYEADELPDDDSMVSNDVTVLPSLYPAPRNLRSSLDGGAVVLEWDEPDMDEAPTIPTVYDFEEYKPLQTHGFDGWKTLDLDKLPCGGIQGIPLEGIDGKSVGFFIFDNSDDVFNEYFNVHSGTKCMMSMYVYDSENEQQGRADDWLISPPLSGRPQTFSFWARSYTDYYPETIQVFYSTGGYTASDWEQAHLLGEVSRVPQDWTEYSYEIPEEARYVAIRNHSAGGFMLLIDDISVSIEGDGPIPLKLANYKLYKDDELISDKNLTATGFTDPAADPDAYTRYVVSALYDKGESKPSNVIEVHPSSVGEIAAAGVEILSVRGGILIRGAEGEDCAVYSHDGIRIVSAKAAANTFIPCEPGIYVVTVKGKSLKINVK